MSETAILSSKFRISIPKAVREALSWKAGQEFAFIPKGSGVMLIAVPEPADLFGVAEGAEGADFRDREDRSYLSKVSPAKRFAEDPFATFAEWDGEADRRAYADL